MANVLVVDDAIFMRIVVSNMLIQNGHVVVGEAGNGREAAEKYKELNPELVIMDITMPDVNGIEGIKLIKEIDPKANIIMCSAMGQESFVKQAIMFGAKDFVIKPMNEERLLKAISAIMRNK